MYSNQKMLRRAAERALRSEGFETELMKGGGSRLRVSKAGKSGVALVRTSSDRWVGWMRKDGEWKGFDEAMLVVVAAIDNPHRPQKVQVYGFDPQTVRSAYVDNLAARERATPDLQPGAPIFIGLDPCHKNKPSSTASNLKANALWVVEFALDDFEGETVSSPPAPTSESARPQSAVATLPASSREAFAARVRQEFADLIGVSPEMVSVEFRVSL